MAEAFVIMQIGNAELDRICDEVFFPAIEACGLEPRRVDRNNQGDLLKSEIVDFISRADIIIADLTNERPNCYLEVGYAMGLGKKRNLIMTVREDHYHGSPNYRHGGPRVHFDLQGYELLFWDLNDLPQFRADLEQRINYRLSILRDNERTVAPAGALQPRLDHEWLNANRESSLAGLAQTGFEGFFEAVAVISPKGNWTQQDLRIAVDRSTIDTFGWPIGVSFERDGERPRPTAGGIVAEIAFGPDRSRPSYDYWNIQRTGDFYFLRSFFEDSHNTQPMIYFNTRIVQVTELLLFLARLYDRLEVSTDTNLLVQVTHGGLAGREISAIGNRNMRFRRRASESEITTDLPCTVAELESHLAANVRQLLDPMFTLFDFFEVGSGTYQEIVDNFVAGRIT